MRIVVTLATLGALLCGCASTSTRSPTVSSFEQQSSSRQILLTVRQDGAAAVQLRGDPSTRYVTRRGYGPASGVERTLRHLAKEHGMVRLYGWSIASLDVYCEVFAVDEGADVGDVLEKLRGDSRVELAQRMNVFETLASHYDDTYVDLQESLVQLEIEPAHEVATGKGITVAVIDSGVDERHPDLRGRVTVNRDLVGAGEGARLGEIHGTAVAGIIASRVNNAEGIVGVAPDAAIAALRACWALDTRAPAARCSTFSLAVALELAMRVGAQIINLSLTGPYDPLLAQLLDVAMQRGTVIVAAVPDVGDGTLGFPASYAGVFAARSALPQSPDEPPHALPAPGREIFTTTPNSGYAFLSGNSLAAAHVSGVIALLLEKKPTIDVGRLATLLSESSVRGERAGSISACRALAHLTGAGLCGEPSARVRF